MPGTAALRDVETLYRYDRVAPVLPSPQAVTDDAVRAYWQNGYLAVASVLTPAEVETAKAALCDLIHGRVSGYDDLLQPEADQKERWPQLTSDERADVIRKVWRFAEYEPRLKTIGDSHPIILSLLEKLLGEPCRMIQDMALLKPPHIGTEKPWHQDAAYFGWTPPERVLGIWIALDPATAENGCMHVIPGTQNAGPTPHIHLRDCQIPDERVHVEGDVIVPLAPGGVLFFSSLLHHGTPPNNSANRRWALQYHYAAESCQTMDRIQHGTLFFEDGHYQGCRGQMGRPLSELEP